jgi:hypothetical protein
MKIFSDQIFGCMKSLFLCLQIHFTSNFVTVRQERTPRIMEAISTFNTDIDTVFIRNCYIYLRHAEIIPS